MSEKLQRFIDLMKQIFELDKSDLDFGIYRIMNIRKAEIERFLSEGLPQKVRDTLAPFAQGDQESIRAQIAEIEKNGWSLVPSKYIDFIDHDLEIDFPAEMKRIQQEMRDVLAQEKESQKMLEEAFRGIGYGVE